MKDLQALLDAATPGPWEVNRRASMCVEGMDSRGVLYTGGFVDWSRDRAKVTAENEANARLASQAPDLAKRVLELEAALKASHELNDEIKKRWRKEREAVMGKALKGGTS